jgi:hypothetical protein
LREKQDRSAPLRLSIRAKGHVIDELEATSA